HLDRAVLGLGLREGGVDVGGARHVAANPEQPLRGLAGTVGDGDGVSRGGELAGDREADAAISAGDEYRANHATDRIGYLGVVHLSAGHKITGLGSWTCARSTPTSSLCHCGGWRTRPCSAPVTWEPSTPRSGSNACAPRRCACSTPGSRAPRTPTTSASPYG